ncbi:hypothetical protein [Capnocytophaga sputigena]|jgi:hypothetical protein|uniref:Uncharacterized protein n=1 Tax=Capnocytophaga sputigena TaxID=1019 RepID=A0AAX2I9X9_CAPSP|nr:hypothetical protein [Capnocytophaga sputigena]ATA71450.1 hypothetical protein CGC57_11275 [Capnocytophaga sputigena]ATA83839.1 hypothetical protein CGC55_04640 [Capnocytophaga sputigena]EEB67012.1 hypothetical protein CAPSP0001_2213 [Capnocytophaga sputigena ATCC 33612]PBN45765.1 hypothetical protein CDC50_06925 [Capnocytophaga sputigena]SQA75216.1 Uncharacterised protein [Capnocytophaga sputigena]
MNITEKIAYKERLITRTKVILAQGKYPTELLEQIKDERLLKEVMKEMMPSAGTAYELLNDEEKQQRDRLLALNIKFKDYLYGFMLCKNIGYLLLITAILVGISVVMQFNNNGIFGVLSLLNSALLLYLATEKKKLLHYHWQLFYVFLLFYIIELIVWQVPSPFLYFIDADVLASRHEAKMKLANLATPLVYEGVRLAALLGIYKGFKKISQFVKAN